MRVSPVFCVLFGLFLSLRSLCVLSELNSSKINQETTLRPAVERIFLRKKRWMIFPKGSSLKFTVSVSKYLLAVYPKGITFNLEAAIYYPMPAARIDLVPKKFRKPTTKAPAPKGSTPIYLVGVPGSLLKYRAKPATKPVKVQRIDQYIPSLERLHSEALNLNQTNPQKWSKYSSPEYLKDYHQWAADKEKKLSKKYSKYSKINGYRSKPYSSDHMPHYGKKSNKFEETSAHTDNFEPVYFEELHPFEDSPHYHSYRGRRELFHHFEGFSKILGIDMKSCILRAVCDSKRFLLPPGYSMIQDILRVIFTFPTIDGLRDDYTRIMETDYQTCDAITHDRCAFSILDWLLNSRKSV